LEEKRKGEFKSAFKQKEKGMGEAAQEKITIKLGRNLSKKEGFK
jgi:hypothetical protein